MLFHPPGDLGEQVRDSTGPLLQQLRGDLSGAGAGHDRLQHILVGVDAVGDGEVGVDAPIEDGHPAEREAHRGGGAENEIGSHLQLLQIDIGLVEAVEEDEAVRAGLGQATCHEGDGAEVGPQLHGDGYLHALAHLAEDIKVHLLHLRAGDEWVGGNVVDVQLERVGARLLHEPGVARPAAGRSAVEAGDHRDVDRLLRLSDRLQIGIRVELEGDGLWEVGERLGVALGTIGQVVIELQALLSDLLLEERRHHDRRRAGIFELLDAIRRARQRRGGRDNRVLQGQAQVSRAQIHVDAPSSA